VTGGGGEGLNEGLGKYDFLERFQGIGFFPNVNNIKMQKIK
jgi:hypothetical protein